jgi:hypothetical protein
MSDEKKKKRSKKGSQKSFASKRTMNPPQEDGSHQEATGMGNAAQEHDEARRLGSFEGTGEHARTGNPGHE